MTHTIRIEVSDEHNAAATADANGQFPVAFIRKQLAADEINPASLRYNAATDTVEFSPDGGTTWADAPASDPRNQSTFPPLTGADVRCRSAASIVRYITDMTTEMTTAIGNGATGAGIGALLIALIGVLGPWGILLDLAIAIGIGVVAIGASAIGAALTTTVWDQLLCIVYCASNENGQLDGSGYALVYSDIGTVIGGTAGTVLQLIVQLMGPAGLNNAAALGLDTDDCSGCGCVECADYDDAFDGGYGPKTHDSGYNNVWVRDSSTQFTNNPTYQTAVYHSAPGAMQGSFEAGSFNSANILIDLEHVCTVTAVSIWKRYASGSATNGWQITWYNENGYSLGSYSQNSIISNSWSQTTRTQTIANCRYIALHVFANTSGGALYIDDVHISAN